MKIMKKIINKIFEKIQSWIFFSIWVFLVLGVTYAYTAITDVSNWDTLTHTKFNELIGIINDWGTFRDTVDNTTCDYWIKSISNAGAITCASKLWECGDNVSAWWYTYTTSWWLDGRCWTSTNMKHWTMIADDDIDNSNNENEPSDNTTIEKWCYENNESYCESGWWLYNWDEAMWWWSSENEDKTKSVCWALLTWWSLPTDAQWTALENAWATWWKSPWNKLWGLVTNNALPGYRNASGNFDNRTNYGYYWSSTEDVDADYNANARKLLSSDSFVISNYYNKPPGFSVLCIKN